MDFTTLQSLGKQKRNLSRKENEFDFDLQFLGEIVFDTDFPISDPVCQLSYSLIS